MEPELIACVEFCRPVPEFLSNTEVLKCGVGYETTQLSHTALISLHAQLIVAHISAREIDASFSFSPHVGLYEELTGHLDHYSRQLQEIKEDEHVIFGRDRLCQFDLL